MRNIVVALIALAGVALLPSESRAQSGLGGVVRDATGAVLPGVTVEAASPALIERSRAATTDGAGQYRIIDLRPGLYSVTFTLPGFTSVQRQGIELTAGFTATVNVELGLGDIAETITVSGAAPVVDIQNVTRQQVLQRETIDSLPSSRRYDSLAALIPGMVVPTATMGTSPYDVGGSQGEGSLSFGIHGGRAADMVLQIDGLRFQQPGSGNLSSLTGFDASAAEINFETAALSAEWGTGGVRVNMIPKEGGNTFRGGFYANRADSSFQSDNFTSALRGQGLAGLDQVERIWDIHPEFGGPLVRDRLWFYGHYRYWGADKRVADSFYNGSGNPLAYQIDPTRPGLQVTTQSSANLRGTWQASPRNKVTAYYDQQTRVFDQVVAAGRSPEAWHHQTQPTGYLAQAKWTSPITSRLLLETGLTYYRAHWINGFANGVTSADYAVTDQGTGRTYGSAPFYFEGDWGGPLPSGSLSYVTGSHALKVGFTLSRTFQTITTAANHDLNLVVLNGQPIGVTQWATPTVATTNLDADLGLYAQDRWTMRRLTLNLGLRFDYLKGSIPAQFVGPDDTGNTGTSSSGRYLPFKAFDRVDNVPNLKDISPRFGASYDLFGTGRTALKASLSRYMGAPAGTSAPATYNPMSTLVTTSGRPWTDDNDDRLPQESELGPLSNTNFGRAIVNTRFDDLVRTGWFNREYNWEASLGVQHQLVSRVSADVSYFRRWYGNFTVTDNVLASPADFDPFCITAPVDSRLPGGGGNAICGLYDITPTKYGQVDNFRTLASNFGERREAWHGVDVGLSAQLPRGIVLRGGISTGKTTVDECEVLANLDNPSTRFCRTETPFLTQVKLLGTYTLPGAVQISSTLQSIPGPPITAAYAATTAEIAPSLGRNLAGGVRTATVQLIQPGTMYGERMYQLDIRVARSVNIGHTRIQPELSVFNALNSSPVVLLNTTYGSQWQRAQGVLLGRFAKLGVLMTF
jgi:hypothetical protein